uniref:G protein-coupled receptor 171 n=1 Tax=Oncorhynchus mykiss TaxID=8022 RepID=A0A8C7UNK0_ONCMY
MYLSSCSVVQQVALVALWVFLHSYNDKKSINVYLVNLLTVDLLLTLALPFKVAKDMGVAPWGLMSSRLFRIQEVGFAKLMSVMVWLLVLLIMVPNMALPIQDVPERKFLSCSKLKQEVGLHWHGLAVFLCTILFLKASTAVLVSNGLVLKRLLASRNDPEQWRHARRATINVTAGTAAYVVCFVPYHVVRTPYTLAQTEVITPDCQTKRHLFLAKESTLLLVVLHLCLDPVLYYYFSKTFRKRVREVFRSRRTCKDSTKMILRCEVFYAVP